MDQLPLTYLSPQSPVNVTNLKNYQRLEDQSNFVQPG
jgi:hypothetical protein